MQHKIYAVTALEIVGPYTLRLTFDDGKAQTINFRPVLDGEIYGPLKDPVLFEQVRIDKDAQTITWPNGADFDPATLHEWHLYENEIVAGIKRHLQAADPPATYGDCTL